MLRYVSAGVLAPGSSLRSAFQPEGRDSSLRTVELHLPVTVAGQPRIPTGVPLLL